MIIPTRYENDRLTVSHDLLNKRAWAPCFSIEGVRLPTGYYFGMSATTGDLSDNHDLISVKTYELDTAPGVSKDERPGILPEVASHILAASWPLPNPPVTSSVLCSIARDWAFSVSSHCSPGHNI